MFGWFIILVKLIELLLYVRMRNTEEGKIAFLKELIINLANEIIYAGE